MVIKSIQNPDQGIGNVVQVAKRQIALVKLSIRKLMVDELMHQHENFVGALVRQRTHGRLNHIGYHTNPRFARLRTRPWIPIILFTNAILLLLCALIEIFNTTRAVVCRDKIANILRQPISARNFQSVALMRL